MTQSSPVNSKLDLNLRGSHFLGQFVNEILICEFIG